MTPSTCSEDLLALQESSENQEPENGHEMLDDIQSTTAFFSAYGV